MKKIYRRFVVLCCIVAVLFSFSSSKLNVRADKIQDTQEKIDAMEKEKEQLENNQQQSENELSGLQGEKRTLQAQLSDLNFQLNDVCANLEDLEDRILLKEKDVSDAEAELEKAIQKENEQYAGMVIRIREMYERNDGNVLNALLGAGGFTQMLNAAEMFSSIERYDRGKLNEYKSTRAVVQEEKDRLEAERNELEVLKAEAEAEQAKVTELIAEMEKTIAEYQADIAQTEAEIKAYEDAIAERESDLEYLYKVLEEEKAKSLLAAMSTWRDISQVTFAEGDRYLLANLIYCEAGGEPYEGQVAVGAVVINRMLSSVYPDTVTGVIYQAWQFSPVASGRLALALSVNKATDSCYRAADEAMSGFSNVGTCVYFRTPIPGLTGISIGGHIFY